MRRPDALAAGGNGGTAPAPAVRCPLLQRLLRTVTAALIGGGLLLPATIAAEEYQQERDRLERLEEELAALEQQLASDRSEHDSVAAELATLDRQVAETAGRLDALRSERRATMQRLGQLERAYEEEAQRLRTQREHLREQIVARYAAGRHERLRLLLSEQDPATTQRLLVYYDYFQKARVERMEGLLDELAELSELRRRHHAEAERLATLEREAAQERKRLAHRRARRDEYRATLEQRIADRDQTVSELEGEVAEQESLLAELRRRIARAPTAGGDIDHLRSARGELPWPVSGELEESFGEARGGGLTRTGIVIAAAAGESVSAVAPGRVVFSDWLRGLGLLVIIDHGEGYLTLYGHNEALYVDLGERVAAGDRVATVGTSGARREPGLYFEIRHGDEPEDPLAWLR
ncbi:hypothetical protein CKO15_00065 [Halorhodospira abdelmalekii]|uniref:murein hydrolase activator EnvC family protein n=1 Tax=Halorhodospira abdelmalekii TaxID=421629 RepID=UPI00190742AA|nr:peptidoglycan DD-metalloendopeptidase family protein [Halorhodospira abdelmalekii]MBK1733701.1 hypothetical protein [Halorhodospira abdelmalekii]